jgi:hypothetical protein
VVQAPESTGDVRLVVDTFDGSAEPRRDDARLAKAGEIRLTYRELTALIEDAVRQLR